MATSPAQITIAGLVTTFEQSGGTTAANASSTLKYDGFDDSVKLTSATTPTVTKDAFTEITLTAGAATIDLTAITDVDGVVKNFNALKIHCIKTRVKAGNANRIKIKTGASNGWSPVVGDNFEVPLPANANGGAWSQSYGGGGSAVVDATHKTLDLVGTGSQVLQVFIAGGA